MWSISLHKEVIILRKLRRAVAKTNMRKKGINKHFKKDVTSAKGVVTSYFAEHWREYV